jgi:hypothetical protein
MEPEGEGMLTDLEGCDAFLLAFLPILGVLLSRAWIEARRFKS